MGWQKARSNNSSAGDMWLRASDRLQCRGLTPLATLQYSMKKRPTRNVRDPACTLQEGRGSLGGAEVTHTARAHQLHPRRPVNLASMDVSLMAAPSAVTREAGNSSPGQSLIDGYSNPLLPALCAWCGKRYVHQISSKCTAIVAATRAAAIKQLSTWRAGFAAARTPVGASVWPTAAHA